MEIPHIKVKKIHPDAQLPNLSTPESAGLDLFIIEAAEIPPGKRALLRTGLEMAIPTGLVGLIWPRSKLAAKFGVDVLAGVIDSDYRGEVMVSLLNTGEDAVSLHKGDAVAQMIVQEHLSWLPQEITNDLSPTERGGKGINSSDMRLRSVQ